MRIKSDWSELRSESENIEWRTDGGLNIHITLQKTELQRGRGKAVTKGESGIREVILFV